MQTKYQNTDPSYAKPSRRFALIDLPDPGSITAEFVYNFFVPDERINAAGDPRVPGNIDFESTQKLIEAKTLATEIPRYISLSFTPGQNIDHGSVDSEAAATFLLTLDQIVDEADMTTQSFFTLTEEDPELKLRMSRKLAALSKLLEIDFSSSTQTEDLSKVMGVTKNYLQPLIAPDKNNLVVNFIPDPAASDMYDKAALFSLHEQLNKRTLSYTFGGFDDVSPLSGIDLRQRALDAAEGWTQSASPGLAISDVEVSFSPAFFRDTEHEPELIGISHVGYVVDKIQLGPTGNKLSVESTLVKGSENTSFIDTKIIYGSKYAYSVHNVFAVTANIKVTPTGMVMPGTDVKNKRLTTFIKSKPSRKQVVETKEYIAPLPPDGVFYRYDYTRGTGLAITWQIPPGRQRDVKFFQIFKRANIHVPFECIAEIDFDNSALKTLRPETVSEAQVIVSNGPQTYFIDRTFNRDSPPAIYAVCAIDAHGLTSGYSDQTLVSFNRTKNIIELKYISRSGSPKQYPNMFIDPDLDENIFVNSFTQDAIFDSGKSKMTVYFTPDAQTVSDGDGNQNDVFKTTNTGGVYKMHILNLDLQKATTNEFRIKDLRT